MTVRIRLLLPAVAFGVLAAEGELDAANVAHALRDARQALPGLVESARQARVSPELLDLYLRATRPERQAPDPRPMRELPRLTARRA